AASDGTRDRAASSNVRAPACRRRPETGAARARAAENGVAPPSSRWASSGRSRVGGGARTVSSNAIDVEDAGAMDERQLHRVIHDQVIESVAAGARAGPRRAYPPAPPRR